MNRQDNKAVNAAAKKAYIKNGGSNKPMPSKGFNPFSELQKNIFSGAIVGTVPTIQLRDSAKPAKKK